MSYLPNSLHGSQRTVRPRSIAYGPVTKPVGCHVSTACGPSIVTNDACINQDYHGTLRNVLDRPGPLPAKATPAHTRNRKKPVRLPLMRCLLCPERLGHSPKPQRLSKAIRLIDRTASLLDHPQNLYRKRAWGSENAGSHETPRNRPPYSNFGHVDAEYPFSVSFALGSEPSYDDIR